MGPRLFCNGPKYIMDLAKLAEGLQEVSRYGGFAVKLTGGLAVNFHYLF